MFYFQWRQTDQSISAMALVVFLPRPKLHSIQDIYVGFFIPQNSPPRPVGTGDPDTSLAPLSILYKPNYNPAGIVDPSSTLWKGSWLQSLNLE